MTVTRAQSYTILIALGWRIRSTGEGTQAVKNFQGAYHLGAKLDDDGIVGPLTSAALLKSYSRHMAGRPDASEHFSFRDFACKCGGRYDSCARIWVKRALLSSLEAYRVHLGGPVSITSGCRCTQHNKAVGGVRQSQHLHGGAADIHSPFTASQVGGWKLFGGIGYARSTGQVRHVDVRTNRASWVYTQW